MAQIICRDLAIGYEGKTVVQNINLSVKEGDYLCVIGENGAGKSTFMKTLLGLLPPVSGKIEFHDGLKKNEIGYLPQQTEVQKDFPASVREIVLSGCQNHLGFWPFYRTKEKKYAEDMMKKLQITHLSKRCYRELSGGQQQRVLLARALCATRKILLLDEPVSGLDPQMTEEIKDSSDEEEKSMIKFLDTDNEWQKLYCRTRTKVDGSRIDSGKVYNALGGENFEPQLLTVKIKNGEIDEIKTAFETEKYSK